MTHGLLLFAHGARDPNWALPFEAVAARVRALAPGLPVALSFLEFMSPTLAEAGQQLAAAGCTQVDIVPLFLGAGGHVRKDLPQLVDELAAAHPGTQWRLQAAVGETAIVVEAMAQAALQPLQGARP
jgi:sirohydrochlorin cobaltochelatase